MKTRLGLLLLAVLMLGPAVPAAAVSLLVLDSGVEADTFARAETVVTDPAPTAAARQTNAPLAIAVFPGSQTVGTASAASVIAPGLVKIPLERVLLTTDAILTVRAKTEGTQSAEATSSASGFIEFQIEGGGNPNLQLVLDFGLDRQFSSTSPLTLTYLVENVGTGATLFELMGDPLNLTPPIPVSSGDVLRVSFSADAAASAAGGDSVRSDIDFSSSLNVNVVPEPATLSLVLAGLAGGLVVRRFGRREA